MIISEEDLLKALGFKPRERAKLEKCLNLQSIPIIYGNDGRITTSDGLIVLAFGKYNVAANDSIQIDGLY